MPATLGADHHVWIVPQGNRMRMRCHVEHELEVVEVRKDKFTAVLERTKAQTIKKILKTFLRVSVYPAVPLCAAEFDCGFRNLERETRFAEFSPNGQALNLCKTRKITNSQTCCRLPSSIADQMRCRKIVTIEFFVIWTFLLRHIDGAADRRHSHDIFESPRDSHRKIAVCRAVL